MTEALTEPLTEDEAARVHRWARRQALSYLAVGAGGSVVAVGTGSWFGWLLGGLTALLVGVAIARWWHLRRISPGLPTVFLRGTWHPGGRSTVTRLGGTLVAGVAAPGPAPAPRTEMAARAIAVDVLGVVLTRQSYLVVEWHSR